MKICDLNQERVKGEKAQMSFQWLRVEFPFQWSHPKNPVRLTNAVKWSKPEPLRR